MSKCIGVYAKGEKCNRAATSNGFCRHHLYQQGKCLNNFIGKRISCTRPVVSNGYCSVHGPFHILNVEEGAPNYLLVVGKLLGVCLIWGIGILAIVGITLLVNKGPEFLKIVSVISNVLIPGICLTLTVGLWKG